MGVSPDPTQSTSEKTLTDAEFWQKYARDSINKSISQIEDSGAKIQTAVAWLWSIYTASAVIGTSVFKPSFPWYINLLIGLPILFIMLAYYFAIRVQIPLVGNLNPNEMFTVVDFHNNIMNSKKQEKNKALFSLLITSIFIFCAIFLSASYQPAKNIGLQTSQIVGANSTFISIGGQFPASKQISFKIESLKDPTKPELKSFISSNSSSTGELVLSVNINEVLTNYSVTAEWLGTDGLTNSVKKIIKP